MPISRRLIKNGGLVFLAVMVWTTGLRADPPKGDKKLECPPDLSEDALEDFRDDAIKFLIAGNYAATREKLKACFPDGLPKCYNDLEYYARVKATGAEMTTYENTSSVPGGHITLKSERDLPEEFVPPGSHGVFKIPENLVELAGKKGWKVLSYKTRSTGGFDTAPNLTIIVIPGKQKDIFIQISPEPKADADADAPKPNLTDAEIAHGQQTATIITTDKTVTPPLGQLHKFYLSDREKMTYRWSEDRTSQGCIACHSMPLRSISPRGYRVTNGTEKRMSAKDEATTDEINAMMMVDQLAWGEMKDRNGHIVHRGPAIDSQPLGWAPENSRTRKPEYIKNCAKQADPVHYVGNGYYRFIQKPENLDAVDAQKVATNMSCMQCHNGGVRGPLHEDFNSNEIVFKVLIDRSMPPGANLTGDERLALVACLRAERTDLRSEWNQSGDWMRKMVCQSMEKSGPSAKAPAKPSETSLPKNSTAVH